MSQCSRFAEGQPIRGGVPVIFPWFGPREGLRAAWLRPRQELGTQGIRPAPDGSVSVRFRLPDCPEASAFPPFSADYVVTVNEALPWNSSSPTYPATRDFTFENCLHTYFAVGDVTAISITGLKGVEYLDKIENFAQKTETNDAIRIAAEVDRTYLNTTGRSKSSTLASAAKSASRSRARSPRSSGTPGLPSPSKCRTSATTNTSAWSASNRAMSPATRSPCRPAKPPTLTVKLSSAALGLTASSPSSAGNCLPRSRRQNPRSRISTLPTARESVWIPAA